MQVIELSRVRRVLAVAVNLLPSCTDNLVEQTKNTSLNGRLDALTGASATLREYEQTVYMGGVRTAAIEQPCLAKLHDIGYITTLAQFAPAARPTSPPCDGITNIYPQ